MKIIACIPCQPDFAPSVSVKDKYIMNYQCELLCGARFSRKDMNSYSKPVLLRVEISEGLTNGVSGGFLAFLVHAVVTSNRAMCSFCFNSLAVRADQHAGHHAQRAITYMNT